MGKSTKKKNKKITAPKANIQELSISRDGGQIALRGYSYQFLYSCYLILSSSNPSNFFQLEGIEDIDCIMQKNPNCIVIISCSSHRERWIGIIIVVT